MARPLFKNSIAELEAAFDRRLGDPAFMDALADELAHRSTDRAKRLRAAVDSERAKLIGSRTDAAPKTPSPPATRRADDARLPSSPEPSQPSRDDGRSRREPVRREFPPITNAPDGILTAWTALEVLSPPAFGRPEQLAAGNRAAVAPLGERDLPWERGEKSRPNCRLYYQVILGTIRMDLATARLVERFGDSRPDFPNSKPNAVLAVVIVDKLGQLVESQAVSVSSFGWGVMAALNGDLSDLSRWPQAEPVLVSCVEKELLRHGRGADDEERRKTPISREAIVSAYGALLRETGLPGEMVEGPAFAIRSYEHYRSPNPPEPLLLNSFFLPDLALARALLKDGSAPQNLKRYLGTCTPEKRADLLRDRSALEAAVAPSMTGASRWPGPGRQPLALLQQAAVNLAFSETRGGGMLGVNGPPGTGKTTLLRDILAGIVAERAEAMCGFDDPEAAFEHSGQRLKAGNAWLHLYRLSPKLRGFEAVVASSNNKAVENVSREIPALGSIAADASGLRYFKSLADEISQADTWGLAAAVLGNAANRWAFKDAFWWNDELSMNSYLSAAAGGAPQVSIIDPKTGLAKSAPPKIVAEEKPPTGRDDALRRWNDARKQFKSALEKSRSWTVWLEGVRQDSLKLESLRAAESAAHIAFEISARHARDATNASESANERSASAASQLSEMEMRFASHFKSRPGFWARLFGTRDARAWSSRRLALQQEVNAARQLAAEEARLRDDAAHVLRAAEAARLKSAAALGSERASREAAEARLADAREKRGVVMLDEEFFAQERAGMHGSTPWFPPAAQRARDDLFVAAIRLHRAFIDAAARPLRSNLGALMGTLTGNSLSGAEKEALLPDLWASLFLVVPLVSTTFASVGRMLGKLPPGSLGWLLIDEAGQAPPQAAVGAIVRARRVVAVGDPAQIEPVVALPDALAHAVARSFGVDPDSYAAPGASVQTLADSASAFSTEFQTKSGSRSVGVPLLVHRRCAEPMFSVSNAIAYSGLMVQAKAPSASPIRDVLGQSRWIHVEGEGEDKWCELEGAEVVRLLRELLRAGVSPDVYVVTPFVIVADRMRLMIRDSGIFRSSLEESEIHKWVSERVGTVHTVQGREAEAVIFILGAPESRQSGARGWAGGRPNILNVAVTRAKEAVYVIGNRRLWRDSGHFGELDARM